jgi:hypothetical protein
MAPVFDPLPFAAVRPVPVNMWGAHEVGHFLPISDANRQENGLRSLHLARDRTALYPLPPFLRVSCGGDEQHE